MPNTPQVGFKTVTMWTPSGGSQVQLDTYGRNSNVDENASVYGTTTNDEAKLGAETFIAGLSNDKFSMEIMYQVGDTATFNALKPRTTGTLEHRREGTGSGKPKETWTAVVTKRGRPAPYDNVMIMSVEWQLSGVATEATQ